MNQVQRKYLIDKIQENTRSAIKALEQTKPKRPDVYSYCLKALLRGELTLRTENDVMGVLNRRALNGNAQAVFSCEHGSMFRNEEYVRFALDEIFDLPEEYIQKRNEWEEQNRKIQEQIDTLRQQTEGLCTRIQLASNKTLESMIAEVDDMGDITFMDCTIKKLMTKGENNLID